MTIALDQSQLMSAALSAARSAGDLILEGHRKRPATRTKSSSVDLVTEYDLRSERLVRTLLEPTGLPIVGEEEGGDAGEGPTWYIDPIDGTTNFAHGHFMFCVSIGLLDQGVPIVGAVVAPALHTEWHGCQTRGAFRNGEPCRVSETRDLGQALVSTGFAPIPLGQAPHPNLAAFKSMMPSARGIRRDGSAALDLCMTADGTFDAYWEPGLHAWDVVGGSAIALAAGASISDLFGNSPNYQSGNLAVSNGPLHSALLEQLCASR